MRVDARGLVAEEANENTSKAGSAEEHRGCGTGRQVVGAVTIARHLTMEQVRRALTVADYASPKSPPGDPSAASITSPGLTPDGQLAELPFRSVLIDAVRLGRQLGGTRNEAWEPGNEAWEPEVNA